MKRGLFIVQLPPPIHGVSLMNERVVADRALREHVAVDVLQLAYSRDLAQINRLTAAKFGRWLMLFFTLWRKLARQRPDFVYFTPVPTGSGYVRDLPFMVLVKWHRVPLILHLHGRGIAESAARPMWRRLYRWGLAHSAVVSASPGMCKRELRPLDLPGCRLYVVPNTVERIASACFARMRQPSVKPRLLFLSSTFPFKGIFVLLDALCELVHRGITFELDIVGASNPEHDARIRKFISAHRLQSHVRVFGALYGADKYAALQNADILVHPTLNDYSPLVILEAMQCGLAIVATNVGAIPEMVIDGVHGWLVPPNDVDALADAIQSLLESPARVRCMGAAARSRYLQYYSPERLSAALLDVFTAEHLVEPR